MIPTELLSIGIGGIIAGIVLVWKRADDAARQKADEAHAVALTAMFARMEQRDKSALEIIQSNTAALIAFQQVVSSVASIAKLTERFDEIERRRND